MKIKPRTEMIIITRNGDKRLRWPMDKATIDPDGNLDAGWFSYFGEFREVHAIGPVVAVLGPTSKYLLDAIKEAGSEGKAYNLMIHRRQFWKTSILPETTVEP